MLFELLDLKPRNPYLSLALDEAIALYMGRLREGRLQGGIRLWSNPPAIVLGRTCKPEENLTEGFYESFQPTKKRKSPKGPFLCRRASGGGTVLHGPGNINYSIFLPLTAFPELYPVHDSYNTMLGIIQKALEAQGIYSEMRGQSDLVISNENGELKKVSGNAQFRKYGILMHHGTLITRKNLIEDISVHLTHPPKEPDYRKGRSHGDFLGSLPEAFDITAFYNLIATELKSFVGTPSITPLSGPDLKLLFSIARHLVHETYLEGGWIRSGKNRSRINSIRNRDVLERLESTLYRRQTDPENTLPASASGNWV